MAKKFREKNLNCFSEVIELRPFDILRKKIKEKFAPYMGLAHCCAYRDISAVINQKIVCLS